MAAPIRFSEKQSGRIDWNALDHGDFRFKQPLD